MLLTVTDYRAGGRHGVCGQEPAVPAARTVRGGVRRREPRRAADVRPAVHPLPRPHAGQRAGHRLRDRAGPGVPGQELPGLRRRGLPGRDDRLRASAPAGYRVLYRGHAVLPARPHLRGDRQLRYAVANVHANTDLDRVMATYTAHARPGTLLVVEVINTAAGVGGTGLPRRFAIDTPGFRADATAEYRVDARRQLLVRRRTLDGSRREAGARPPGRPNRPEPVRGGPLPGPPVNRSQPGQSACAGRPLPQPVLEDLAGGVAGHRVHDLHRGRALVPGQPPPAEVDQLGGVRGGPGRGYHDRPDRLPPLLVRHTDHRDLGHRGVLHQDALHLGRVHVLPAGDDHVIDPVGEEQVPVGVQVPGVAGA